MVTQQQQQKITIVTEYRKECPVTRIKDGNYKDSTKDSKDVQRGQQHQNNNGNNVNNRINNVKWGHGTGSDAWYIIEGARHSNKIQ